MNYLCVYILECSDKTYYTGVTNNIERRILEHQSGECKTAYIYSRRPVILKWYSEDMDANNAIGLEKKIKKWSRKKKEALICGNWDILKEYSSCNNITSHKFYKERLILSPFDSAQGDCNVKSDCKNQSSRA